MKVITGENITTIDQGKEAATTVLTGIITEIVQRKEGVSLLSTASTTARIEIGGDHHPQQRTKISQL